MGFKSKCVKMTKQPPARPPPPKFQTPVVPANVLIINTHPQPERIDNNILFLMQLPTFGAQSNESFENFKKKFEAKIDHLPNEKKINTLLLRLHGVALDTINNIIKTKGNQMSYQDLINVMETTFPDPNTVCLNTLNNRQQLESETLTAYANDIKKKVNHLYHNSTGTKKTERDKIMIDRFINGVNQSIKAELQTNANQFKTLKEAVMKANELQQHRSSNDMN
jgi:hypothetical protein